MLEKRIIVGNLKTPRGQRERGYSEVRCDRGTPLGNPFLSEKEVSPLEAYDRRLWERGTLKYQGKKVKEIKFYAAYPYTDGISIKGMLTYDRRDACIAAFRAYLWENIKLGQGRLSDELLRAIAKHFEVEVSSFAIPSAQKIRECLDRQEERVLHGTKLRLMCHCKPKACHGDVIRDYLIHRLSLPA